MVVRGESQAWAAAAKVCDPEIPVLTIEDLGVLRDIHVEADNVTAVITPTYSGCPAMGVIELNLTTALLEAGFKEVTIKTVLSPAWTTDWLSDAGRQKLKEYGIAPPVKASGSKMALFGADQVACPHCGSAKTERVSEFGSTACKALYRCNICREPFDYFKCI